MRWLIAFAVRWLVLALSVWAAAWAVGGIHLEDWQSTLAVGLVMGVLNAVVRPCLILISLPITILSLGLFLVVINTGLLLLGEWLVTELTDFGFAIDNVLSAVLGALAISVVNFIVTRFIKADRIAHRMTR